MAEATARARRPLTLIFATLICLVEVAVAPAIAFLSANITLLGPYLGLYGLIGLICVGGIWFMKRWSLPSYVGLVGVNHMVLMKMGAWNPLLLVLPTVVLILAGINFSKMD